MHLPTGRSICSWQLSVPDNLQEIGFREIIHDECGLQSESEIWFIGELT
ncbi:DUF3916 domain-containing protein [Virgibacillus sp.]|nr:DUF3916 domain-containing protein [Virgibacillus sp.]